MGLISKTAIVKWNYKTKKWYEDKGYKYTKKDDEFEVKVEDLSNGSTILINVECDCENCKTPINKPMPWYNYLRHVRDNGKYYCRTCGRNIELLKKNSVKSFYDWCLEHNRFDISLRWDFELNGCSPSDIFYNSNKQYYFKCPRGIHPSELKSINNFIQGHNGTMNCNMCNSFGQWCVDNLSIIRVKEIFDRWDYKLNGCSPFDISFKSGGFNQKGYWFKCLKYIWHPSELHNISNFITNYQRNGNSNVLDCNLCNSLGQWFLDNKKQDLLVRWDYKINNCSPFNVSYGSAGINNRGYYFKCPKRMHSSELKDIRRLINNYNKYGNSNILDCTACNSIGQYICDTYGEDKLNYYWNWDKNGETLDPFEITKCSNKKVYIYCQEHSYHGSYPIQCNDFYNGYRCPYCTNNRGKVHPFDSLGYYVIKKFNKEFLDKIWSDRNIKSSFEYAIHSQQHAYFKCTNNKHEDSYRIIASATRSEFRCPDCVSERKESSLQEKIRLYLESSNNDKYTIYHEYKCTIIPQNPKYKGGQGQMPFDNEIILKNNKHLIIETMGEQHEKLCYLHKMQAKKHSTTPEYEFHMQKVRDRYKRIYCKSVGYLYIAISYKDIQDNENYKTIINNKLNEIKNISVININQMEVN
jgi:hypothetical protein